MIILIKSIILFLEPGASFEKSIFKHGGTEGTEDHGEFEDDSGQELLTFSHFLTCHNITEVDI